jgi:hypothetical protein
MRGSSATFVLLLALSVIPSVGWTQTSDDLFNGQVLQRVDLRLHSADWEKLKADFLENTYYPADLSWNGVTVRNVGIRSRGHGSRSGNKPGLRVDFDRYSTDQELLGLKSLVLDNLTQDSSGIHETVTMALFSRLGIPAPREAHARLYVNNEYAGLYVIVEAVDKRLLARVFGAIEEDTQNDGFLFEFNWENEWHLEHLGEELRPYKERFDAKTNESKSDEEKYRPIEELVRLVNETREDRLVEALRPLLDLPAFIRYVAFPTNEGHDANVLMNKLMRLPEYKAMYRAELQRAIDSATEPVGDATWMEAEIRRQLELIDAAMREDPLKPYDNGLFDSSRGLMSAFTKDRIAFVRCELERGPRTGCESVIGAAAVPMAVTKPQ